MNDKTYTYELAVIMEPGKPDRIGVVKTIQK